jgi:hypothetical protein
MTAADQVRNQGDRVEHRWPTVVTIPNDDGHVALLLNQLDTEAAADAGQQQRTRIQGRMAGLDNQRRKLIQAFRSTITIDAGDRNRSPGRALATVVHAASDPRLGARPVPETERTRRQRTRAERTGFRKQRTLALSLRTRVRLLTLWWS